MMTIHAATGVIRLQRSSACLMGPLPTATEKSTRIHEIKVIQFAMTQKKWRGLSKGLAVCVKAAGEETKGERLTKSSKE